MSSRIDEYHGVDAKVLTTDEVERWQEFLGDGIQLRRTLATTRALEKAQTAQTKECARADMAYEACRAALARAERAERERDEVAVRLGVECANVLAAQARVSDLEAALLDACREKVVHGHTTTLWTEARRLDVPGLHELHLDADRLNSEHKTLVAELVEALEGLFVEYDNLRSSGSKYALTYWVDRLPDHACSECVPGGPMVDPGFKCREHAARATLAKAKEAANG